MQRLIKVRNLGRYDSCAIVQFKRRVHPESVWSMGGILAIRKESVLLGLALIVCDDQKEYSTSFPTPARVIGTLGYSPAFLLPESILSENRLSVRFYRLYQN